MTFQNEQVDKTSSALARINWGCISAMIIILLVTSFFQKIATINISPETSSILYFVALFVAIILIPLSNWMFNKRIKRIKTSDPKEISLRIFRVAFLTKLVMVSSGFVVDLIIYFLTTNTHLLIVGGIYIVYQMIALPGKDSLFEIVGVEENE